MKKILISALVLILLCLIGWGFLNFGTGKGYNEYIAEREYRRLHPEFLPPTILVKAFDMGHSTSYASFTWLELIQYIADNIGGNDFLNFSHTLLDHITTLHPYFAKAYEIDLILAPTSAGENFNPEERAKNKIFAKSAIEHGKKGMQILCDTEKIKKIQQKSLSKELWSDISLKNPCTNGNLPYYVGFVTYQMGDKKSDASEYYKIASMNADAPEASGLLGILALSAEGDYRASAMNFALLGSNGYDIEPFTCKKIANEIVQDLSKNRIVDKTWLKELNKVESLLKKNSDSKNIISNASDNCYEMTNRAIETIYLNYIANIASGTTAKNGDELIQLNILKEIPTISRKKGYTVRKKGNMWEYQARN